MTPDEGGFTLIEALVALALGVSVVAVVLSTLHVASDGAARAVAVAAEAEGFARTAAVLTGDARHALLRRDADGGVMFQGQPKSLSFPALARQGGAVVFVLYALRPSARGTDLTRSEAVLLPGGPGPMSAPQTLWQSPGQWEFRFRNDKGDWARDWTLPGLPRGFGLVNLAAPQTVTLTAAFPDLMEPACALGPGPQCSLPAEVFP